MNALVEKRSPVSVSQIWEDGFHLVLEKAGWIAGCTGVALLLAIIYLIRTTPVYEAKTTVEVEQEESKILNNVEDVRKQDLDKIETLKTIEQNLQSQTIFFRVAQNFDLKNDPDFRAEAKAGSLTDEQAAGMLAGMVDVRLRRGTRLIDIFVDHSKPLMAQKLANEVVREYMRQDLELRSGANASAFSFLVEEAQRLRNKLGQSEQAMQAYQEGPGLTVAEMRKKLGDYESQLALLSLRYRDKHPKIVALKHQIELCQNFLQSHRDVIRSENQQTYTSYDVLTREVEADKILYESVLRRLKETQVTKAIEANNVRIVEPALAPALPLRPRKTATMVFALFGGLVVGIGSAWGRNILANSLKTVDQAETALQLPVMGSIPLSEDPLYDPEELLYVWNDPDSEISESFRSLRAALGVSKNPNSVLLFTSAGPGEGKTFCCSNCAISLAQQGFKTLLIEGDLRRPSLDKIFLSDRNYLGITDYLAGHNRFQEVVADTAIDHLSLIPIGSVKGGVSEKLSPAKFNRLIEEALRHYDRVIIDTAPMLSVGDTLLMLERVEGVFLVVHSGRTARKAAWRAVQLLERVNARLMGVILNGIPLRLGLPYYYSYSARESYGPLLET